MSRSRQVVDKLVDKAMSRKLLVFAISTVMLAMGWGLDVDTWGWIALTYIGSEGAIDSVRAYKGFEPPVQS